MKSGYRIPSDIYEKVHELLIAIVNAGEAEDDVLSVSHKNELLHYCEEQTTAGRGSGFMWEALADVTDDPGKRFALYKRALEFAYQNQEPTHTILLTLGELHAQSGDLLAAEPFLTQARQQAIICHDLDAEGEATALLLKIQTDSES